MKTGNLSDQIADIIQLRSPFGISFEEIKDQLPEEDNGRKIIGTIKRLVDQGKVSKRGAQYFFNETQPQEPSDMQPARIDIIGQNGNDGEHYADTICTPNTVLNEHLVETFGPLHVATAASTRRSATT